MMTQKSTQYTRYYLGKNYPNVYLTPQEAYCVTKMLNNNLTYDDIGKKLRKSPATVNFYLRNVRMKLRCKNRKDLIERISQTDFIQYVDHLGKLLESRLT